MISLQVPSLRNRTGHVRRHVSRGIWLVLIALTVSAALISCTPNRATGERHLNLVSESQEIAMGRQADSQVVASIGIYPDAGLRGYVQELGTKLAKTSERPNLPWSFRVVDDPAVNAFALPGGFICVTRGLMAYVQNEAELAGAACSYGRHQSNYGNYYIHCG